MERFHILTNKIHKLKYNTIQQITKLTSYYVPAPTCFMFLWPCIVSKAWRGNTNKMQQFRYLLSTVSTCFVHHCAHHKDNKDRVLLHMVFALVVLDVAGCIYYQHCLNMFRASLCPSSGEQRPCITAYGVCAGSVGCGWLHLLSTLFQHVSCIIMPIIRRTKTVYYCIWCLRW